MRIRKPIIIIANKKKTKKNGANRFKNKLIHNEQASTKENTNDKPFPVLHQFHSPKNKRGRYRSFGRRLKGSSQIKTVVIATISAIVIGTWLGFIMLNMFDGIGTDTTGDSGSGGVSSAGTDNAETETNESTFSLPSLSAYVLQGGVFSNEENATDWVHKFQKRDHPAMVWKQDNQFTLLTGIAWSEDQAESLGDDFTDEDIYVKEWKTKEAEITVTNAESEWLKSFADIWKDSVKAISADSSLKTDKWEHLLDQFPEEAEQLIDFQEQLQQSLSKVEEGDNKSAGQLFLLEQWLQYEKIGRSEK